MIDIKADLLAANNLMIWYSNNIKGLTECEENLKLKLQVEKGVAPDESWQRKCYVMISGHIQSVGCIIMSPSSENPSNIFGKMTRRPTRDFLLN